METNRLDPFPGLSGTEDPVRRVGPGSGPSSDPGSGIPAAWYMLTMIPSWDSPAIGVHFDRHPLHDLVDTSYVGLKVNCIEGAWRSVINLCNLPSSHNMMCQRAREGDGDRNGRQLRDYPLLYRAPCPFTVS